MANVIFEKVDEKGRPFRLVGDLNALASWADYYINANHEDPNDDCYIGISESTIKERLENIEELKELLHKEFNWEKVLDDLPRKKNGTFAKNRVHIVWRGYSFEFYCEERYGYIAPEVRVKNLSDDTAEIQWYHDVVTPH